MLDQIAHRRVCVSTTWRSVDAESSSLVHFPNTVIALNRTIRDGTSYASSLTPVPEEWFMERDWYIVHHWQDQFCRDVYQDLCKFQQMPTFTCLSHDLARHNTASVSCRQYCEFKFKERLC